jgi:hypothetical protein
MKTRRVLVGLFVFVAALLAASPFLHLGRRAQGICEWLGGSWASTSFSCITRSCYQSHTCGSRYCPACYCKGLAPGASLADVYVRLGEPMWVKGSQLTWPSGAADPGYVVATVNGEQLASINCFVAERP